MGDLNLFIQNTHQIAMAILGVVFSVLILAELPLVKKNNSKEMLIYFSLVFSTLFLGLTYTFLQEWKSLGGFYSIEFALFCVLGLVSPKYAVAFFLYLLMARPWETFPNQLMETMPRDYFYIVVLSLLGRKLRKQEYYVRLNLGTFLTVSFAAWLFLTGFLSNHFSEAITKYIEVLSKGIIIFVLLQNCFEKASDTLAAKAALVISILEMGIISARNTFEIDNLNSMAEGGQRLESIGILSNSNDIAAILILALPFCVFFFLRKGMAKTFWPLALASFGLITALVWASQSRGALVAFFAGVSGYLFTKLKRKKHVLIVTLLAGVCAMGSFSLLNRGGGDLEGSTTNRIIYWKAGLNMAVRNPLFGVGFWGYNDSLAAYAIDGNIGSEGKKMTAHSSWVQVISENGFPGFFFFAGLWLYALFRSWKIRFEHPEYFCAIAAYGTAASFLSHAYLVYPYILLGLATTQSFLSEDDYQKVVNVPRFLKEKLV